MKYLRYLQYCDYRQVSLVGGKAASLGEMLRAGIPVPPGFVITTDAFRAGMTGELEQEITEAYETLGVQRVAVRSSAVAEDSKDASWAGQLESYLNVTKDGLIEAVEKCWSSINSERAKSYADEHNVSKDQRAVAVVIQVMVDSEISGVMFTANPVSGNRDEVMFEAAYGLGEMIVQGMVTPESIVINKKTNRIISRAQHRQITQLIYKSGKNTEVPVKKELQDKNILTQAQIKKLSKIADKIEHHYAAPQDIEWAISENKIYIVQSRPITTLAAEEVLPEFFHHCVKTIARPATLQRDEIFRYTANKVLPIDVVTVPLEGTNRAYYLEADAAKRLLATSLDGVNTQNKLKQHLKNYKQVKAKAQFTKQLIETDPRNYEFIFKHYFKFLDMLSPFLYVGVAIDKVLYLKFKVAIEEQCPDNAEKIIEIVATPKGLHDYQKQRLAICELLPQYKKDPKACEARLIEIVTTYRHTNEYSFVEPLVRLEDIQHEMSVLTLDETETETKDIRGAIESETNYQQNLARLLENETLLNQSLLIKEYALLRTDRIDRLKLVQAALRSVFEELAKDFTALDKSPWTSRHVANLLNHEIDGYIEKDQLPSFKEVKKRLDQRYLYYFENSTTTVVTDNDLVAKAQAIVIKPEESQTGSLISTGTVAYKGVAQGIVTKITNLDDLARVSVGDIMVARVTMPDHTVAMKKAAGIVTAEGGITSHAAIVARELKKPCIVGSDNCMEILNDGDLVELDGLKGQVRLL